MLAALALVFGKTGISQNVLFVETVQRAFIHAFGLLSAEEPFLLTNFHKAAGAGFVVVICGNIMTMPGLPKKPAAVGIDVDADGKITGLF